MKSYLEIKDMVFLCKIGVPDAERQYPQKIFVTCLIYADFTRSEASDDIEHTVDYCDTIRDIQTLIDETSFHLIEHLAESIRTVVKRNQKVERVDVEVRKPNVIQNIAYVAFMSVEAV